MKSALYSGFRMLRRASRLLQCKKDMAARRFDRSAAVCVAPLSVKRDRRMQASSGNVLVRNSRDADVSAMLAIYHNHIRKGVDPRHQGDIEAPDADDIKRRRKSMLRRKMP